MYFPSRVLAGFLASIAVVSLLVPAESLAAREDFRIRRIDFGYKVRSGSETISGGFAGFGNIGGFPQKWGIVTVRYDSKLEWADNLLLKYYVLLRNSKGKQSMLTGSVEYVSVRAGLDHAGFVFIHPNTMARYGAVRRILVEIWYQGVLADSRQWPAQSSTRWWNRVAPISGALRPRFYTPFEHDYEVREEDIKITPIL